FNYLGQSDQILKQSQALALAQERRGRENARENRRRYLFDVDAVVRQGRLRIGWSYGENLHRQETIEQIAGRYVECLREIIAHCRSEAAGGYTPSDFPLVHLEQEELDRCIGRGERVEDIYPLSPMQEGLLFHTLYEPGSGVYCNQFGCRMENLDANALRRAWEQVIERHAILRTAFLWEGLKGSVEVVYKHVELPWREEDWRELDQAEQERSWKSYLQEDSVRGFDMAHPPLMRLALMRTGEDSYYFAWSNHHILMDGWCRQVVIAEVLKLYEAYRNGQQLQLEKHGIYRDYIAWLKHLDYKDAELFWREELKGFSEPKRLWIEQEAAPGLKVEHRNHVLRLGDDLSRRLEELARRRQVTMNAVVQGAWGLLLGRYSGQRDVVFGATVSGRSAAVKGIESLVGLFINTLPVRAQLAAGQQVDGYLKQLQQRQVEARQHEYSPLAKVQEWSDVARGVPLFEYILVFENFPMDSALRQREQMSLEISDVRNLLIRNSYPLTLRAIHLDELVLDV